jgi:hypothetical protein
VTYFTQPQKRQEVLELMARILNFNEEEKVAVGLLKSPRRSWRLFRNPFTSPTKTSSTTSTNTSTPPPEKSLTDLWIEFLLKEATGEQPLSNNTTTTNNNNNNNIKQNDTERLDSRVSESPKR